MKQKFFLRFSQISRVLLGLSLTGVLLTTAQAQVVPVAPRITTQPQSQTVTEGDRVTFTVEATGGSYQNYTIPISNTVNLDMIYVEPGTFTMGSPSGELGRDNDETQHTVTLTQGYWLGKYEVTQAQWKAVMGSNPASGCGVGDNYPVYDVSWDDIMGSEGFCAKLTAAEKAAGRLPEGYAYTLPTEAQWEYACRAGTTTALNSGKNLTQEHENCPNMDEVGWYTSNSSSKTHEVGQKQPNAWGLYDMHGNVYEWCKDWYGDYPTGAVNDPTGPSIRALTA